MCFPRASTERQELAHLDQELRATQRRAGASGLSSRFCRHGGETLASEVILSFPSRLREMGLDTLTFPFILFSDLSPKLPIG